MAEFTANQVSVLVMLADVERIENEREL